MIPESFDSSSTCRDMELSLNTRRNQALSIVGS